MIRQRKPAASANDEEKISELVEFAKKLDAFPRVPEKYTKTTKIGGICTYTNTLLISKLIPDCCGINNNGFELFQYRLLVERLSFI